MELKRIIPRVAIVSALITIFFISFGAAQPWLTGRSAYVDEHFFEIIISADEYLTALLTHEIDMGGIPRPQDQGLLEDAGYTISRTTQLGYTFLMEDNRRWPFGGVSWVDGDRLCGWGTPDDPNAGNASCFRKAIHRLINKPECVNLYAPLMSGCEYYLPPGMAYWINPAAPGMSFNPGVANDAPGLGTASSYLNEGGFTMGLDANTYADVDTSASWYSPTLRIDPRTEETMEEFEYYAIGPSEAPVGYEMAELITSWIHTAGIPCRLEAGTWLGMVINLVNDDWYDYQMMTGVGIVWGAPSPDILYDFTFSKNLPLWDFSVMNISAIDEAGMRMMSTLDLLECRQACWDIQTLLTQYEPYMPMLLWENFLCETGPYEDEPGMIGVVNYAGQGPNDSSNVWGKMLTRAGRAHPTKTGVEINKWGLGAYLDTLNPLTADTVPDWQCLANIMEGFYSRNPYTLGYMWWGAESMPTIEEWIGPGGSWQYETDHDGCEAEYDSWYNGTHYACVGPNDSSETPMPDYPDWECTAIPCAWNGTQGIIRRTDAWIVPDTDDIVKPIGKGPYTCDCGTSGPYDKWWNGTHWLYWGPGEDEVYEMNSTIGDDTFTIEEPEQYLLPDYVVADDLAGDDQLGMVTTWTLRPGMYWHDSNPGDDMEFGTDDDGATYPVTTADAEFCQNLLRYQENQRYMSQWVFVYGIEVEDEYTFKLFEERRFLFSFEGHDVCLLAPKHIWEDYIFVEDEPIPDPIPNPSAVRDDYLNITMPCGAISHADCWYYYSEHPEYYDNHHDQWRGWEDEYIVDPSDPEGRMLTHLIGFGPFKYHYGGWIEGESVGFDTSLIYFAGHVCPGDLTFNQRCEPATDDIYNILENIGPFPTPAYPTLEQLRADTCYPAQVIELSEQLQFDAHSGHYWGPDPVPDGFVRCEEIP